MVDQAFDVDAYFSRVKYEVGGAIDEETLRVIHRKHVMSIPYENYDAFLSDAVPSLSLEHLQRKLLLDGRGGWCYEHNTLFAAVLTELGFKVTILTGRVKALGSFRPRIHMLLLVELPGGGNRYIADVGFGLSGGLSKLFPW